MEVPMVGGFAKMPGNTGMNGMQGCHCSRGRDLQPCRAARLSSAITETPPVFPWLLAAPGICRDAAEWG